MLLLLSVAIFAVEPQAAELDLRDEAGKVLVSSAEITAYDWASHTLILKKGVADRLSIRLIQQEQKLAMPFVLALDGKTVYRGELTTGFSSQSLSGVVIVLGEQQPDKNAKTDRLSLELGYPSKKFFQGNDPRGDERIKMPSKNRENCKRSNRGLHRDNHKKMNNPMTSQFLQISPKITVLPIIHGSGDFAIEVRRVMLSQSFDCLAVPLPASFQNDVERAIAFLPGISAVMQEEVKHFSPSEWSPDAVDDDDEDQEL